MTLQVAVRRIRLYEEGKYTPTLSEAIRWEQLKLGRIRFVGGKATFVR